MFLSKDAAPPKVVLAVLRLRSSLFGLSVLGLAALRWPRVALLMEQWGVLKSSRRSFVSPAIERNIGRMEEEEARPEGGQDDSGYIKSQASMRLGPAAA